MIAELLLLPESRTLDFKREEVPLAKALRTIVAFANTAGGRLVIGVADDKAVPGVRDIQTLEERYANGVANGISPPLLPEITCHRHAGKDVLVVRVPRQPGPFFVRQEGEELGTYVRLGSTNRAADDRQRAELRRLALEKGFDERACLHATLDDLDQTAIDRAFAATGRIPTPSLLESLGVVVRNGGERMPSNGGLILFGTEEARMRLFPNARFRGARFDGTSKGDPILDRFDDPLTLIEALERLPVFVRRNTRQAARIEDTRRQDILEYGPLALREVLANAAAHADHSHGGMTLNVFIYNDRLDVESPGVWPVGYSEEDFREGVSNQRNRVLANVLRVLNFAEYLGTGFERISRETASLGYPLPEWIEAGQILRVRMRPHPMLAATAATTATKGDGSRGSSKGKSLRTLEAERLAAQRQEWFVGQVRDGAKPTAESLASHFGIGIRSAFRDIAELREAGILAFEGHSRGGHYVLLSGSGDGNP